MYYLDVNYVTEFRENGVLNTTKMPIKTEICQIEWFGKDYQDIFSDQPVQNYYCIKNLTGMALEGYSNLERFSYIEVTFFPCVGKNSKGEECYNYTTREEFFRQNVIELTIQDNDLNPLDYKIPVVRRQKQLNSPVYKDLFQLIYCK